MPKHLARLALHSNSRCSTRLGGTRLGPTTGGSARFCRTGSCCTWLCFATGTSRAFGHFVSRSRTRGGVTVTLSACPGSKCHTAHDGEKAGQFCWFHCFSLSEIRCAEWFPCPTHTRRAILTFRSAISGGYICPKYRCGAWRRRRRKDCAEIKLAEPPTGQPPSPDVQGGPTRKHF